MSASRTQDVTLRFEYRYQYASSTEVYREKQSRLAKICRDHLQELDHPWGCDPVDIESGNGLLQDLIELSVQFILKGHGHDSIFASQHARQLWQALKDLFSHNSSQTLFGGRMISLNMYPVYTVEEVATNAFTFGFWAPSLAIEEKHIVQVADPTEAFSLTSGPAHAAVTFLRIIETCSTRVVGTLSTTRIPIGQELELASRLTRDDWTTEIPLTGPSLVELRFELAARLARDAIDKIEPNIAQPPTKELLSEVAEVTAVAKHAFTLAYNAAIARVNYSLEKEVPTAEDYGIAVMSVQRLIPTFSELKAGSEKLAFVLTKQRTSRNSKVAAVAFAAGVSTAALLLGPSALAAAWWYSGAVQIGTAAASASGSYLATKKIEEAPQISDLEKNGNLAQERLLKLQYLIVGSFITNVWKMDLRSLDPSKRENLLQQFGVDLSLFAVEEYQKAHLKSALAGLQQVQNEMLECIDGLYLDLGVKAKLGYLDPSRLLTAAVNPTGMSLPA